MQLKADVEKRAQPQVEVAAPAVPQGALPDKPEPVPPAGGAVEQEGGVHTRWWFWTAIGAVVVGGAVTGAVLAAQPRSRAPASLGELQW